MDFSMTIPHIIDTATHRYERQDTQHTSITIATTFDTTALPTLESLRHNNYILAMQSYPYRTISQSHTDITNMQYAQRDTKEIETQDSKTKDFRFREDDSLSSNTKKSKMKKKASHGEKQITELFHDITTSPSQERQAYLERFIQSIPFTITYCKDNDEREECWDTNKDQWQDKKIAGFSEIYQAWEKSLKDLGDITIGDNTIQSNSAKFSHAAFHAAYSFCQEKYGLQAVRNKQYAIYKNPFGNSLESTKEIVEFVIKKELENLQMIKDNPNRIQFVVKAGDTTDIQHFRDIYGLNHIPNILFFTTFLDNLNTLTIQGKSNATNLCGR